VIDRGMGISPELLQRLFQPFSQAESSLAHPRSGLGLGLALVKELVERHGGAVSARSEGLGHGAEFAVVLPLASSQGQRREDVSARGGPARRRRILVIEDNPDAAHAMRDAMLVDGHEVRLAPDGAVGVEVAREWQPDVLLCDIGLPSMDGYEVARAFRADPRLKGVFLVAITGHATAEDQERAALAGFDRHFAKPPEIARLQRILDELPASG
jgi:CheY-like chemotaxis protein